MTHPEQEPLDAIELAIRKIRILIAAWVAFSAFGATEGAVFRLSPAVVAGLAVVFLLLANVLSHLIDRYDSRRPIAEAIAFQIALDLAASVLVAAELLPPTSTMRWLPLLWPVFEAALRYRFRGLLLVWSTATFLVATLELVTFPSPRIEPVLSACALLLVISLPAGFISRRLCDELARYLELGEDAHRQRWIAGRVTGAGARLAADASHEVRSRAITELIHLGFVRVEFMAFDASGGWVTLETADRPDHAGPTSAPGPADLETGSERGLTVLDRDPERHDGGGLMIQRVQTAGPSIALRAWTVGGDHHWRPLQTAFVSIARMTELALTAAEGCEANDQLRRQLNPQPIHDPLTGLLSRTGLADAIRSAPPAGPGEDTWGLLYFTVTGLQTVNDRLGRPAGDALLREIAARLAATAYSDRARCARLEAGEFAVLHPLSAPDQLDRLVMRFKAVLDAPYPHLHAALPSSIGAAALAVSHEELRGDDVALARSLARVEDLLRGAEQLSR